MSIAWSYMRLILTLYICKLQSPLANLITIVPIYMYPHNLASTFANTCKQKKHESALRFPKQTNQYHGFTNWSEGTIAKQSKVPRLLYLLHYSFQRSTFRSAKAVYFLVPLGTKMSESNKQKFTKKKLYYTPTSCNQFSNKSSPAKCKATRLTLTGATFSSQQL